jgi:hypothetical protein
MVCTHPECTGVHDNNRYAELCQRSLAAKRIKDRRYVYNPEVVAGRLTKGWQVRRHRDATRFHRYGIKKYGPGSRYAELFGVDREEASYWEGRLAEENARFRAERERNRGTRRKIETICSGPFGIITERMVIVATRHPELRTYYR